MNSLAVLAALDTVGVDIRLGCRSLERFEAAAGRGARIEYRLQNRNTTFIDESYNANPLSMAAALNAMWQPTVFSPGVRRIAVLGDMRELGDQSARLHRELLGPVTAANVDKVFACGPFMRELYDVLPQALRGAYAETSTGLIGPILAAIAPGDVIMVKGSLGTRMAPIVDALKAHLAKLAGPNHH